MPIFKTFNDLVVSKIETLRLSQPNLDTKPGTVARDLFVDAPAEELEDLYSILQTISGLQSFFSVGGTDLNRLASNFDATRTTGNAATGVVVFTTNNMDTDILIPSGSVVTSRSGINFETTEDTVMLATSSNTYRANATRFGSDLSLAAIDDDFAIEVNVQSQTIGTSGNIGRFGIISHNISGVSSVTNLSSFSGGTDAESDDEFRTRILSIFAGSNTGTALGYETAISIVPGVLDSEIVVPGDPLMIRDGTDVSTDNDGNLVVTDPGTGGKVDIYVLGTDLESQIESFIYNDQGGNDDPTDSDNDVILGQSGADTSINAAQRRVTLLASGNLPFQPVDSVLTVAGSASGSNFVEKFTDTDGSIKGNYELIKDTDAFGGSTFGFDRLRWISDRIQLLDETVTKGVYNGSDSLGFSDVEKINSITQDFLVTNENSTTSTTQRSIVTLRHTPVRSTSRVINLTTGERYTIEDQNPDGNAGELNTTGRITISGSTLPIAADVLQVDYTWVKPFDNIFDFDNLDDFNSLRTVQGSVDWGFGNLVKQEPATIDGDAYGIERYVDVTHPVSSILSVNTYTTETVSVSNSKVTLGSIVNNIIDMKRVSDNFELYNTDARDGALSGTTIVSLPTDTLASDGDSVVVRYNTVDVSDGDGYVGAPTTRISLPEDSVAVGASVLVNYVANVSTLISEIDLTSLPILKSSNKFIIGDSASGEQPTSNLLDSSGNFTHNLRRAGSNIYVNLKSIPSAGTIVVAGTTIKKLEDVLVTVTAGNGYKVDLQSAILEDLGLSSVPSGVKLIKVYSVEGVTINNSTQAILSVDNVYDMTNYKIQDNAYDLDMALEDSSLNSTSVLLSSTTNNTTNLLNTGDVVRVTLYYTKANDTEQLYFSKSGIKVTDKTFIDISRVSVGSGLTNTSGVVEGNITISNYNQPINGTSYSASYDYLAPKENERITVTFNHNNLINTSTLSIEDVRPITADVLVKAAVAKQIDVSIKIIILPSQLDQEQTILQDAVDAVTSFLSSSSLGSTVDASDVINALYAVSGIDRVRVLNFSSGDSGNVLSISAERNEYLDAGTITIEVEER